MLLVVEAVRWVRRDVKRSRTSNGSAMLVRYEVGLLFDRMQDCSNRV